MESKFMEPAKANYKRLFDDLLEVLNKHQSEDAAVNALVFLKAARENYLQGSIDQMLSSLILTWEQVNKLDPDKVKDLNAVLHGFIARIFAAAAEMGKLAEEYEAGGGKPLSREEIQDEVDARRGAS